MKEARIKNIRKSRRARRVRGKILTQGKPRLTVFRSNRYIYGQIIDDKTGKTLLSASEKEVKEERKTRIERAIAVGKIIAEKAAKKKVKSIIFDKGSYRYHGRVKAFADGAREGGLDF